MSKIFTRLYNKGNNIKRMLIILLMLSMAAGIFTACSSSKNTDNSGKFTVGFDAEFPPYGYKDDNG